MKEETGKRRCKECGLKIRGKNHDKGGHHTGETWARKIGGENG